MKGKLSFAPGGKIFKQSFKLCVSFKRTKHAKLRLAKQQERAQSPVLALRAKPLLRFGLACDDKVPEDAQGERSLWIQHAADQE